MLASAHALPTVTILVPTYNRASFLRGALSSVLAQTYPAIQVIVLDDASPDETPQVAAEFAHDPRLVYLRQPQNLGITGNWQAGIRAVTSEFFCILNDDDTLEPDFVATLVQPLVEHDDLILSSADHWMMDERGERLHTISNQTSHCWKRDSLTLGYLENFGHAALIDQSIFIGATIFRRRLVTPEFIKAEAQGAVDIWLFYQCVRTGYQAYYTPDRLLNYRLHGGGMSQERNWRPYVLEGLLFLYHQMSHDPKLDALHRLLPTKVALTMSSYGINLLALGRPREAQKALAQALHLHKNPRTLLAYGLAFLGPLGSKIMVLLQDLRGYLNSISLGHASGMLLLLTALNL
ncbi:glycosyltransferase family 2 protein [Anthocerotibacter panamensis]|uniref:glycosyltransferase family 2 protein n=1 Tax=Anthocerotibacter panamensis TaxID=2857077 RepID=UPI001C403D09|nr:glycosyltransferase family 2 protein [Anthocerotibacter panamensis]